MAHAWAIILGLVQGATEFLPISSSAHLALIPWLARLSDPVLSSLPFDIALHAGSLVAIVAALWGDWIDVVKGAVRGPSFERRLIGFLLLTSVPGAIFGVLLEKDAETVFRSPLIIGITLIVFGVVLWAVDRFVARQDPFESVDWVKALLVGVAQAFAIVPGVSRSGATITAGRALGLSREAAAKYSFMAALPIIAGAVVFGLRDMPLAEILSIDWLLGFVAAAVSSYVAMRFLLSWVRTHSLAAFMYYRVVVGVIVLAVFFIRG